MSLLCVQAIEFHSQIVATNPAKHHTTRLSNRNNASMRSYWICHRYQPSGLLIMRCRASMYVCGVNVNRIHNRILNILPAFHMAREEKRTAHRVNVKMKMSHRRHGTRIYKTYIER